MKQHSKYKQSNNMELQLSTILFFFLIIIISTSGRPSPPTPTSISTSTSTSNQTDNYIRTTCAKTRYPQTCLKSLSKYSKAVKNDPSRLATVAIKVALYNATSMSTYVSKISRHRGSDNTTASAAIRDCSSMFGDAVDEIYKSKNEMNRIGRTGESVRFQLSNVQTWMSAALTNEDTCIDGFEEVAGGDMKAEVCGLVAAVKEVTSNALALVNSYVDTLRA